MSTILLITIIAIVIPIYVYFGYPLTLFVFSKLFTGKKIRRQDDFTPKVSLLVSCYNEVDVVEEKIKNSLGLDYPEEQLEIFFISDGSDDGTDEIIQAYKQKGIHYIRQEGRLGKTMAINMTVPKTSGEIIVFSDANAMYKPDAIQKLVRNFCDHDVGYVVGAALYIDGDQSSAAASENRYWQYELWLKTMETKLHSVVGGDGAIYAIRKKLFEPMDQEDINDFINPLQIIVKGYRGIFEPEAVCYEETAGDFKKEARRKQRIVNRSFRALLKMRSVLNPFKTGIFSFEIISHKLLRWLIPVFLIIFMIGCTIMSYQGLPVFKSLLLIEIVFIWLAYIGYLLSDRKTIPAVFYYPYYFLLVNTYSLIGVFKALAGDIQITWNTHRADGVKNTSKLGMESIVSLLIFVISVILFVDIFII